MAKNLKEAERLEALTVMKVEALIFYRVRQRNWRL
jgi:ribosomal protein L39E